MEHPPSETPKVQASDIDRWNRAPFETDTPGGEFVVHAVETYNWLRLSLTPAEMAELQQAAQAVITDAKVERPEVQAARQAFLEKVREAAQRNGDASGEHAVAAIRELLLSKNKLGDEVPPAHSESRPSLHDSNA